MKLVSIYFSKSKFESRKHMIYRCIDFIVLCAFGINSVHESNQSASLCDNLGTPILKNLFEKIIKTYHKGSNFFIDISLRAKTDSPPTFVTPAMLESHLVKYCQSVLRFKDQRTINKGDRTEIFKAIVNFMKCNFGVENINRAQKEMSLKAAFVLFPSLKNGLNDEEAIVRFPKISFYLDSNKLF